MKQDDKYGFESLACPIFCLDENGKIIYKNESAKKYRLLRLNTNFRKYVHKNDFEKFDICVKKKDLCVVSFNDNNHISDAAIYYDEKAQIFVVCVIIGNLVFAQRKQKIGIQDEIDFYRRNLETVEVYKRMCEHRFGAPDDKLSEIVSKNTRRLMRALHHMELYFRKYSSFEEQKEIICVNDAIRRIALLVNDNCSVFGYRVNASSAARVDVFMNEYPRAFYSAFASILTIALRLSEDGMAYVDMYEEKNTATISISVNAPFSSSAQVQFESDIAFIQDVAFSSGWKFSSFSQSNKEPGKIEALLKFTSCDADENYKFCANAKDEYSFAEYIMCELSILENK